MGTLGVALPFFLRMDKSEIPTQSNIYLLIRSILRSGSLWSNFNRSGWSILNRHQHKCSFPAGIAVHFDQNGCSGWIEIRICQAAKGKLICRKITHKAPLQKMESTSGMTISKLVNIVHSFKFD